MWKCELILEKATRWQNFTTAWVFQFGKVRAKDQGIIYHPKSIVLRTWRTLHWRRILRASGDFNLHGGLYSEMSLVPEPSRHEVYAHPILLQRIFFFSMIKGKNVIQHFHVYNWMLIQWICLFSFSEWSKYKFYLKSL